MAELLVPTVRNSSAAICGVAYAAIPGADGQINSCYDKTTGALRVVDTQPCNTNESS